MNRSAVFFALVLAAASAGSALAHGAGKHLKGTVASVASDHLVVKDASGKSHDVKIDPKTRYRESSGAAAEASDVHEGDRVIVHLGEKENASTAVDVRFHHASESSRKP